MKKEEIQIKIKICDRTYPMRIAAEDEYILRKSSKELNDAVLKYMNKFAITDKQDLLAMVAFDAIVTRNQTKNIDLDLIQKKLDDILSEIEDK